MSDLLNSASLVMIPSGYAEDKVYSVVPSDGSGDLSFTRASNGTRINSAGLVEVCPWNLLQQSEDFTNAAWTTANLSVTSNSTTAPNGTTTADTITEDTSTTRKILYNTPTIVANQEITLTIYVKANTLQYIRLIANDLSENFRWFGAQFNLTALTYTSATGSNGNATFTSASITDAGNGWYRISVSGTINTTSLLFGIFPSNGTALSSSDDRGGNTYLGTGKTAYIWGAQLNIGSTAKPYFPTTDRLNVPRLTYQNGGGGCPSLLLEKQSTNFLNYSEQFTNVIWVLDGDGPGQSVTANYSISPDGTQNAERLQLNKTGGSYSRIRQNATRVGVYTFSVYLKSNTSATQNVGIRLEGGGINCAVTPTWQRFSVTTTTVVNAQSQILLFDTISGNDEIADISIWGAQLEASSYSTSYIQTTSSSATRVADACFKTGISSLIGQTEGVFYAEFTMPETQSPSFFSISDGTTSNRILFGYYLGALRYYADSATGAFAVGGVIDASPVVGQVYKIAIAYKSNDFVVYKNGTNTNTLTTFTIPASLTQMDNAAGNAGQNIYASVKEILLFKTRLTNAELASLTTI